MTRVRVPLTLEAINSDQLEMYYQPVLDVQTMRAAGVEALVRWHHPEHGLLVPEQFLFDTRDEVVLLKLGEWTLNRVARQAAAWATRFDLEYYRLGINLSPRQFLAGDVVSLVGDILSRHDVKPEYFIVEVLESELMDSRSGPAQQISRLREFGLRVAIDDFGSGFANLSYLRDLPIDMVKVDRRLVGLEPGGRDGAILRGVARMARELGADTLLEGIETPAQLAFATACGVTFGQGYLIGGPLPVTDEALPQPAIGSH